MGDEDEEQPENEYVWQKYFLKPLDEGNDDDDDDNDDGCDNDDDAVCKIVAMRKENGEAGHLSVRLVAGKFVLVAGSKNVHLMFRSREDVAKYVDSKYLVASAVALAVIRSVHVKCNILCLTV